MKIIQIMPEFGLAGAETMCENLSIELSKLGLEVIVVSMFDYHSEITKRLEEAGIRVVYLGKKPGLDLNMIPAMIKLFKEEKPDIIHTHRYVMQYAVPAAIAAGVKGRVHTVHNIAAKENTPKAQKLNNLFYHYAGVVPVALSEEVKETVLLRYKLKSGRVPIIFNGVNLDKCIPKDDYAIKGGMKLLHIGRFAEAKNHIMMLSAFKKVVKDHPEMTLTLVGTGELLESVKNFAKEEGLMDKVIFYGTTADVYPLLHEADAFFLPSSFEGMPMTLIEAMGTGLPIVTTMVGGIPDMLKAGEEAILTEVEEEAIEKGLRSLFDISRRRAMGQAARSRALKDFSAGKMAEKYKKLYNQVK